MHHADPAQTGVAIAESVGPVIVADLRDEATWFAMQPEFFQRRVREKAEVDALRFCTARSHPEFERHVSDAIFERVRSYRTMEPVCS